MSLDFHLSHPADSFRAGFGLSLGENEMVRGLLLLCFVASASTVHAGMDVLAAIQRFEFFDDITGTYNGRPFTATYATFNLSRGTVRLETFADGYIIPLENASFRPEPRIRDNITSFRFPSDSRIVLNNTTQTISVEFFGINGFEPLFEISDSAFSTWDFSTPLELRMHTVHIYDIDIRTRVGTSFGTLHFDEQYLQGDYGAFITPEPSSVALFGFGIAGIVLIRRNSVTARSVVAG